MTLDRALSRACREECYYVGMDEETGLPMKQVTYEPNAKVPNCGTITFKREDHTLGNLLRHQLLTQDKVRACSAHPQLHCTFYIGVVVVVISVVVRCMLPLKQLLRKISGAIPSR